MTAALEKGGVCVVAGVGPGNGAALTRRFAAGGYQVAMLARSAERLTDLEREVAGAHSFPVDITDRAAVETTFAAVRERLGPVDVLVHNAAAGAREEFLDLAPETLERTFKVNVLSLLHCGQLAARDMLERDGATTSSRSRPLSPRRCGTWRTRSARRGRSRPICGRSGRSGEASALRGPAAQINE